MIPRRLEIVTSADIADLVTTAQPESNTLEYKEQLPGPTDSDKKEFFATSPLSPTRAGAI